MLEGEGEDDGTGTGATDKTAAGIKDKQERQQWQRAIQGGLSALRELATGGLGGGGAAADPSLSRASLSALLRYATAESDAMRLPAAKVG